MNDQQASTPPVDPADGQDSMLPPIQAPPTMTDDPAFAGMPAGQTVPDARALVPVPGEAADSDLIEKEWVLKAKQIVEHTADDPFRQQEELSKMKADYLKKRYNKDLA
jgi:hypothetical protein